MNTELPPEGTMLAAQSGARRAYEGAMLRLGLTRAAIVTALVGALALAGVAELPSPAWLLPVFVAWLVLGWRGGLLWSGAIRGLGAGLAALALPMSVLRPCCGPGAMVDGVSCSMPEVCIAAGAVLGLVVAATLPRMRTTGDWARAAGGALVAVTSVVASRCVTLVAGESLGLLGGLLAAAAGIAAARAWWGGRTAEGR